MLTNSEKLNEAINNSQTEIVAELLAATTKLFKYHEKQYFFAMELARWDCVKLFIEKGIPVNTRDKDQQTALIRAASSGDPDLVRFLCERGADVNVSDRWDRTPLSEAARTRNLKSVEILASSGANLHENVRGKGNLLFESFHAKAYDVLEFLLKNGVSVDESDYLGRNIFELAKKCNDQKAMDLIKMVVEQQELEQMIRTDYNSSSLLF